MTRLRTEWVIAAAVCVLLAVIHTWPLASAPASLSRNDNGDAQLNEWILAWVAHEAPRAPADLFQGNIFYPAHDTLAFSEPLIVPGLLGAPVAWLGGSPVLVYNLMLLAGFALTALGGYALVTAWTGDRLAGLLAGSTLAFNSHTLSRLAHVQGVHLYGLPLAVLAIDRLISGPRPRHALALAMWMTVLAYTSGYLVIFTAVAVGVALLVRAAEWIPRARTTMALTTVAAIVATVAILPVYLPYRRVAEQGMTRTLDEVAEYSAKPIGYVAAPGRIHTATWSAPLFATPVDTFFPGVIVVLLAGAAVLSARAGGTDGGRAATGRVVMLLSIAALGFLLSLGTATPVYGWLYAVFPPMHGIRAAARFGVLVLFALSTLAALALAWMRRRASYSRASTAAAVVLLAFVNLEALRAPLRYRPFDGIPAIYDRLATDPRPVVLVEVPFYVPGAVFGNSEYVVNSTRHFRPLLNGYSGYVPPTYVEYAERFRDFPADAAVAAMRRAGVTHVMLHPQRLGARADDVTRRFAARADVELVAVDPTGLQLYRLR